MRHVIFQIRRNIQRKIALKNPTIPPRLGRFGLAGFRFAGAFFAGVFLGAADPLPGYRLSATKGRLRFGGVLIRLPARPNFSAPYPDNTGLFSVALRKGRHKYDDFLINSIFMIIF